MIKLVAIDIDDTLITDDLQIPPESERAIKEAMAIGTVVTLATGRMHCSALPFARELAMPEDQPIITYNGAMIRTISGELINHIPLDPKVAADVIEHCKANSWTLNAYYQDKLYVSHVDDNVKYYQDLAQVEVYPVGDLLDFMNEGAKEFSKLLIVGLEAEIAHRRGRVQELFCDKAQVVRSKQRYIEITHLQATKGKALAALATRLGISASEVMAIGDSNNDISMLQYAGVGIAVATATAEAKAKANHVLGSVAAAIVKFVLDSHNIS